MIQNLDRSVYSTVYDTVDKNKHEISGMSVSRCAT